ncbi:D-alanyl-D-alanine carboxypeptidase/D-alanyl-D-alanine-endopeptidase, partial [Candidatus Poribacteria bacterium]|nr:D-alanyl-D-alanine carboxypeptidase/D-alanyl-D-alanine-endopeptidase [Candidatus Poribacteria bacterium]
MNPARAYCLLILLVASALPCRAEDAWRTVAADLDSSFTASRFGANARFAAVVIEPETGLRLLDINAAAPMRSASLAKLFTAGFVLDTLGPSHRFRTTIETSAELDAKGVLHGDLVIRGGGDPSLGPRFQVDPADDLQLLDRWADDLRAQGIRRIDGDIIGDGTCFGGPLYGQNWDPVDRGEWFAAEVDGLSFYDSCVDVLWTAEGKPGKAARFRLIPDTDYIQLRSMVRIGPADSPGDDIAYFRHDDEGRHLAKGTLPRGTTDRGSTAVPEPARYTAHVFREALERHGIRVKGDAVSMRALAETGAAAQERRVLVSQFSPAVAEMLPVLLGKSHNL